MAGAKAVAGLVCALWLAVASAALAQPSCGDWWNTQVFFQRATAADVSRCLEAREAHGWTPLHQAAARNETPAVVAVLLAAGADLGAREEDGGTPLHLAAAFSETQAVVAALLDADADPAARDAEGRIPWDHIKDDSPLKGTNVYRRLSEARFP